MLNRRVILAVPGADSPYHQVVARKVDVIAALLEESRELEEGARGIQGERELLVSEGEIEAFVERYHAWFGRAVTVVSEEFRDRLRAEFNGSWHSQKIKHFLEAPGEVSVLGGVSQTTPRRRSRTGAIPTTRHSTGRCSLSGRSSLRRSRQRSALDTGRTSSW